MNKFLKTHIILFLLCWLIAGQHCLFEQLLSASPISTTENCPAHVPAESSSHNEGQCCKPLPIVNRSEIKAAFETSFNVVFYLVEITQAVGNEKLLAPLVDSTAETPFALRLRSLSIASNAPPVALFLI